MPVKLEVQTQFVEMRFMKQTIQIIRIKALVQNKNDAEAKLKSSNSPYNLSFQKVFICSILSLKYMKVIIVSDIHRKDRLKYLF